MGKNRFIRVPNGVGAPPGIGAPPGVGAPPGMGMPAAPQMPEGMPGIPAPPGSVTTEMTEADGLKFRLTKMEEAVLKVQEEKLTADEQILKLMKENLDLRKQINLMKTSLVYKEVGIEARDQVTMKDGKFYRIRPPAAQKPPEPGRNMPRLPAPKPPDLKIFRDEQGREMLVPKEPPPAAEPPESEPPAPEEK